MTPLALGRAEGSIILWLKPNRVRVQANSVTLINTAVAGRNRACLLRWHHFEAHVEYNAPSTQAWSIVCHATLAVHRSAYDRWESPCDSRWTKHISAWYLKARSQLIYHCNSTFTKAIIADPIALKPIFFIWLEILLMTLNTLCSTRKLREIEKDSNKLT